MCSVCPQRHCGQETPICQGSGLESSLNSKRQKEETFPARCGCDASQGPGGGGGGGRHCPSANRLLPPFFSYNRSWNSLLFFLSAFSHCPRSPAHAHAPPATLTLTHARKRVAAARSATLSGAPSRAPLPPVVVGRRPRLPTVLSNGPGSRIGPAAGTTPARLLHSSDTRASRDI